jgi:hypothetical protein
MKGLKVRRALTASREAPLESRVSECVVAFTVSTSFIVVVTTVRFCGDAVRCCGTMRSLLESTSGSLLRCFFSLLESVFRCPGVESRRFGTGFGHEA